MADDDKNNDIPAPDTEASISITPELETNADSSEHLEEQPKPDQLHDNTVIPFETENPEQNVTPESGELNLQGQPKEGHHHETIAIADKQSEQDFSQSESEQLNREEHSTLEQQQENTVNIHATEEELAQDEEHEGINVDDNIHTRTNVDNEVHEGINEGGVNAQEPSNDNITEEHFGIVQEHAIATVDTRIQVEADSHEVEGKFEEGRHDNKLDNEGQDRSVEVPGEMSNDTTERMKEMEGRTEDVVIGEHLETVSEEDQSIVGVKDGALKTTDQSEEIQVEQATSLSPQEKLEDFDQSQVSSIAEQNQSETQSIMQGRRLYGHIHNIFGKQHGEEFLELYRNAFENRLKTHLSNESFI